jgi:hypothetical protein
MNRRLDPVAWGCLVTALVLIVVWWTPIAAWVADTVQHVWPW